MTFNAEDASHRSRMPSIRWMRDPGNTLSRWAESPIRGRNVMKIESPVGCDLSGKITEHLIAVRVYDRFDNVGVAKTVIPRRGNRTRGSRRTR